MLITACHAPVSSSKLGHVEKVLERQCGRTGRFLGWGPCSGRGVTYSSPLDRGPGLACWRSERSRYGSRLENAGQT